jgi:hypothetical protein
MIKTLYVNGCSWTEGYLLEEEPHVLSFANSIGYEITQLRNAKKNGQPVPFPPFEVYNNFNWAGHIAKNLGIDNIINRAEGGGSNARILRTTVDYVRGLSQQEKQETLVVIGWTLSDRSELYLDDRQGSAHWMLFNGAQSFRSLIPRGIYEDSFFDRISDFWDNYVLDVHSTYACMYNFFQQSELLANFLENQGIKYYFFNSFPIFWGIHDVDLSKHQELRILSENYNNNYSVLPTSITFAEFVGEDKSLQLSDGHPNSLAYRLWAYYITEHIKQRELHE